jgi:hypothetical protein
MSKKLNFSTELPMVYFSLLIGKLKIILNGKNSLKKERKASGIYIKMLLFHFFLCLFFPKTLIFTSNLTLVANIRLDAVRSPLPPTAW